MSAKEIDQSFNVSRQVGPVIELPSIMEDPALKVMDGGKIRRTGMLAIRVKCFKNPASA